MAYPERMKHAELVDSDHELMVQRRDICTRLHLAALAIHYAEQTTPPPFILITAAHNRYNAVLDELLANNQSIEEQL